MSSARQGQLIQKGGARLVVGLGLTGVSLVRFFKRHGFSCHIVDAQQEPARLPALVAEFGELPATTGTELADLLTDPSALTAFVSRFSMIAASPGVPLHHPLLEAARSLELPIKNDIGFFLDIIRAEYPAVQVVAITGSNGKSTVTDGTAALGQALGLPCRAVGNIGTPVLDIEPTLGEKDILVLELSSYQLELIDALGADVALLLNMSADHLDRHGTMQNYWRLKQKIYARAKAVVVNKDDPLSTPLEVHKDATVLKSYNRFGLGQPDKNDFGLVERAGELWIARGVDLLAPVASFKLTGSHNIANILAILGIAYSLGWPLQSALGFLQGYQGLAYRCQIEPTQDGVIWLNDSKGTNVGASLVALKNGVDLLKPAGRLWWIAGGLAKGGVFKDIADYLSRLYQAGCLGDCYLYGHDQQLIADALINAELSSQSRQNLTQVVHELHGMVQPGDVVVFSPACASMDQFKNFEARGQLFSDLVREASVSLKR